jgi:signal peptidase I
VHGCPGCPGDRVLVDKVSYDLRDVRRGEIVVFSGEGSWGSAGQAASADAGALQDALTTVARAAGVAPAGRHRLREAGDRHPR